MNTIQDIARVLKKHNNYIITAHCNPDGDALGSMSAFAYILRALSKNFVLYTVTGVPEYLSALPFPDVVYTKITDFPDTFTPESIIVLDVSDPKRIGDELYALLPSLYSINIDHHKGCPLFGTAINFVEPEYSATGCIVAEIAKELGIAYAGELGEALYLSITEDTGNFRNGNTDALSFSLASEIVSAGLNVQEFMNTYKRNWTVQKMQLWGELLSAFTAYNNGTVLFLPVSEDMLAKYSCTNEDIEGINNFLMNIKGVRIVALLKEVQSPKQGVKISLRSYGVDISLVAQEFGGGGHKNASGAFIANSTLEEAEKAVYRCIKGILTI